MIYAAQTKNKFPLVHTCQIKIEFFSVKRVESFFFLKMFRVKDNVDFPKQKFWEIQIVTDLPLVTSLFPLICPSFHVQTCTFECYFPHSLCLIGRIIAKCIMYIFLSFSFCHFFPKPRKDKLMKNILNTLGQ
jgi:hypothetical protein